MIHMNNFLHKTTLKLQKRDTCLDEFLNLRSYLVLISFSKPFSKPCLNYYDFYKVFSEFKFKVHLTKKLTSDFCLKFSAYFQ